MFQLLRRISGSVFPRNDRPWADDATSTAPTIGRKRRLSSADTNLDDTPIGSLSKKSRREKDADVSDDEGPTSSPVASSPPPPRSSPPPEDVKEVTTGVREIELDQNPKVPLSDPSEVVQPPAAPATGTSAPADEEVETDTEGDPTPEQRSGKGNSPELEGSQDPVKGDATDEDPVKPVQEPTGDSEDITKDTTPLSATVEEPATLEDKPEVTA